MHLSDARWPELGHPLLVVPVGSCEQHGPHLPLGTDSVVATALAEGLAARRADTVVAPALHITSSGEHAGFPGTLSIGAAATELVVVELVRSADWASGVVLVNGHGGNARPVTDAVRRLTDEGRRVIAWWPKVTDGDLHAGATETSLLLALRPDLVRTEAAAAGPVPTIDELVRDGVRAHSP
ncbi:MAG: mycofactocin biosynthesis peptidyl-dipeptidase MftE, partial [Ilumatobacteraceae bacterium]|nr:mycofactocin biosynthesis peptidyl-dipeptidase MftE [Ilumatobacteraceae bacterium]